VTDLLDFLRNYGLEVEGIFRRSAEISSIRNLQARINKGDKIDFINDPQYKDRIQKAVIDASVLLKTFLRSLGEPILTNKLYPELIKLSDVDKERKPAMIKELLRKLPPENYTLLKTLNKFLTEVAEKSSVNLMDANNLSVV
jgi:Rho GTPase-activating protein 1